MDKQEYLLELKDISKRFDATQALDKVSFGIKKGEVRALVGENGAGKSTLIKIIAGALQPDEGEIYIDNKKIIHKNPRSAINDGITVIYQELDLVQSLSGVKNLFLGSELRNKVKTVNNKLMYYRGKEFLESVGSGIDLKQPINNLTIAEQQIIAICKAAISGKSRIILMDEPSASLNSKELENLFNLIKNLKKNNVTIIYISHRLEEIFNIADSVTVLRDGKHIVTKNISDLSKSNIIEYMIGKEINEERINKTSNSFSENQEIIALKKINYKNILSDVSFNVTKGEIFGVLGLVGSGREELAKILYGIISPTNGSIYIKGQKKALKNPSTALDNSITYVPSDRRYQGLFLNLSSLLNVGIMSLKYFSNKFSLLNKKKLVKSFNKYKDKLKIKVSSYKQQVSDLSGGNQQKILIARCLSRDSDIIILNEPTRGIDVGTKFEIYQLLMDISSSGKTIIVFSTEVPEVVNICNRILILKKGKVEKIINSDNFEQSVILNYLLN